MNDSRVIATIAISLLAHVLAATRCAAQTDSSQPIEFGRQIRPILADKCFACHGPDENHREGGLRLDQKAGAIAEADSGSHAIVPGDVDASELIARLVTDDDDLKMPPADSNKVITPEELALIQRWIEQGAPWQEHWAFLLPQQDVIPAVANKSWLKSPVDLFVLSRLEKAGLAPSPPADKRTLIRRVTLDLTGLPPTTKEVDAFLADNGPDAYERVVDRLLNSDRYGEHRARFWLDAVRYGDTHGLHLDNYREMWPYRDWVVRAFNSNMPFDQFVIKQLAGDLLPEPTDDDLVATGFNRCHVTTNEGGSINEEVYVRNVVDRVTTTGTVFMGLSFECTRCHDHKYDPLTMRDFYSMFAFFNSLDGKAMDGNTARHAPIIKLPTEEQQQQLSELAEKTATLKEQIKTCVAEVKWDDALLGIDAIAKGAPTQVESGLDNPGDGGKSAQNKSGLFDTLEEWIAAKLDDEQKGLPGPIKQAIKTESNQRTEAQNKRLQDYFVEHACTSTHDTFAPLHDQLKSLRTTREKLDAQVASTLIFKELTSPRPSFVLHRGEYDQKRDQVERATPAVLPPMPEDSPRNRLGMAQWLTNGQHPLTARVTVNRLWQQVFGVGIVKTSEDFGSQGESPSHPQLLDWLAVQFVNEGWDVKATMKRLVMSATYRQSSKTSPELAAQDPANRLLARGPRFRLDAEMLRDQALAVSGLLVNELGGPSVKPPQPSGLWHAVGYSGSNTVRFNADKAHRKVHRRTLYTFIKRTAPPPQLSTFDAPSRELCTVRRERTNTPLQALLLMNDPQYVEAARALAERVLKDCDTDTARVERLFRLCLGRSASETETGEFVEIVADLTSVYAADASSAKSLVQVDLANQEREGKVDNEPELAAWTVAANLMLNLDEVITKN